MFKTFFGVQRMFSFTLRINDLNVAKFCQAKFYLMEENPISKFTFLAPYVLSVLESYLQILRHGLEHKNALFTEL